MVYKNVILYICDDDTTTVLYKCFRRALNNRKYKTNTLEVRLSFLCCAELT